MRCVRVLRNGKKQGYTLAKCAVFSKVHLIPYLLVKSQQHFTWFNKEHLTSRSDKAEIHLRAQTLGEWLDWLTYYEQKSTIMLEHRRFQTLGKNYRCLHIVTDWNCHRQRVINSVTLWCPGDKKKMIVRSGLTLTLIMFFYVRHNTLSLS